MSKEGKFSVRHIVVVLAIMALLGFLVMMVLSGLSYPRSDSKAKAITNNLRQIASAGQSYFLETGSSEVTYSGLLLARYFDPILDVNHESYDALVVKDTGGVLRVITQDSMEVAFTY